MKIFFLHNCLTQYRLPFFTDISKKYLTTFTFTHQKVDPRKYPELNITPYNGVRTLIHGIMDNDIIVTGDFCFIESIIALILSKLLRKKTVTLTDMWSYPRSHRYWVSKYIYMAGVRLADKIIYPGVRHRRYLIRLGAHQSKLRKAPYVSELHKNSKFRLSGEILDIKKDNFVILYLGRIVPYKGLDILVRAVSILGEKYKNIALFYGGEGEFLPIIRKLIKNLTINNCLYLGDWGDLEKYAYFKTADVFVVPSTFRDGDAEQWGLVVNEAMCAKKAVICSDQIGCCEELIINNQTGLFFKGGDAIDLSRKIEFLYLHSQIRETIATNGNDKVKKEFTYPKALKSFIKCIESLD